MAYVRLFRRSKLARKPGKIDVYLRSRKPESGTNLGRNTNDRRWEGP